MRVALLGFGSVAESTHLPGFAHAPGGPWEVAAVAEPSAERRAVARRLLPKARIYESADRLLGSERELDLADVVAPPFLHVSLVRAALQAGLHVLCEKPLSLDVAAIEAMGREARARERVVYTVNNWRHAPLVDAAVRLARSGELGALRFVGWSVRRKAADPGAAPGGRTWREDPELALGGILVDHGWHALTVVHALLGAAPRTVSARLARDQEKKVDVEARLAFEQGGARVVIRLTWRAGRRSNRALLVGESGTVRLEDDRLLAPGAAALVFPEKLSAGSVHLDWFPAVLRALEEEISGRVPRGTSLREAAYCAATIQAAYDAASSRGSLDSASRDPRGTRARPSHGR